MDRMRQSRIEPICIARHQVCFLFAASENNLWITLKRHLVTLPVRELWVIRDIVSVSTDRLTRRQPADDDVSDMLCVYCIAHSTNDRHCRFPKHLEPRAVPVIPIPLRLP